MKILVINTGSSSVKFNLYESAGEKLLAKGLIERINAPDTHLNYSNHRGQKVEKEIAANSSEAAISEACLALMDKKTGVISNLTEIEGIGHRVVHGGATISGAVKVSAAIKQVILDCFSLAPLHNPPNYEGIEACEHLFPNVPMVAVFDTAFHQTMPSAAYTYAIPKDIADKNQIRRYGFHGTSHYFVAVTAAQVLGRDLDTLKLITAHLGNGCSITAVNCGKVVDTSMGLTPLEGLVMGTRCGDIDPAVVIFLSRLGYSLDEVDRLLNKGSGLLGLAGIGSNDMRDILKAIANGSAPAKLALDVFVHRLVKYVGAYAAVLNGFDALIFTAGIGENVAQVRAMVCEQLTYLGIHLDPALNKANALTISREGSLPAVLVIPTNEELMIARETLRVLMS
ncbi:MAG: acetate kinase [Kiritimatiellae bacterium]|nr:acetate kinase [Verrucomicrobiota bacterium]MBU4365970.1 acetate kinase [Verrucomicrobiota bacterium]MCG2660662.1 acetate kinase [Kiritimatiellia bacterium]